MDEELKKELDQLAVNLAAKQDELKALAEEVKGKLEHNEKISTDTKESADEAIKQVNELAQLVKRQKVPEQKAKDWGSQVINSEEFKAFEGRNGERMQVKAPASLLASATGDGSVAAFMGRDKRDNIHLPQRKLTVLDLIRAGATSENAVQYSRETSFVNNADVVAEGAKRPQSTLTMESVVDLVEEIAHSLRISKIALSDSKRIQSFINGRLMTGLNKKLEAKIVAKLLAGAKADTEQVTTHGVKGYENANIIDKIRYGILFSALEDYYATAVLLNPFDSATIDLTKDKQGKHLVSNPTGAGNTNLWSLPVVESNAQTKGSVLVGDFDQACMLTIREAPYIELGYNGNDFSEGMITVMSQLRAVLEVYNYGAFNKLAV